MNSKNTLLHPSLILIFTVAALLLVLAVGVGESSAEDKDLVLERRANYGLGSCQSLAYDGDYLYVGQTKGLTIFDVSDPSSPELVGNFALPTTARGVTVEGGHAYVANAADGLVILDISDKENLGYLGGNDTYDAYDVAVSGDYAYVADYYRGLIILDISDKENPQYVGDLDTDNYARGVEVKGDHAFVADGTSGLVIIDISDRTDPQETGRYDTSGLAYGVVVEGDHAYVADSTAGLVIVDVSDTTDPHHVGSCDTDGSSYRLAVDGDYAYMAESGNGLVIIDISDKTDPQETGTYNSDGSTNEVVIDGSHAYLADYSNGLVIVDISDKGSVKKAGEYDTDDEAKGVAVEGDYAYVADYGNGLVIVDISDKTDPQETGGYDPGSLAFDVAVDGDYAYLADFSDGLVIIDISDKTDPQETGRYDTAGNAYGVAVDGDYAYVADRENGLVIVDVTDKSDPQEVGHRDTAGSAYGVAVSGDHAYVADSSNGFVIIDISDKTDPQQAGHYDTKNSAYDVALDDDYAYVADYGNGLVIIDISDKTDPTKVAGYDTWGYAYGVAVSGNYAYVADGDYGLIIVDVADKTEPLMVGHYDADMAVSIVVVGDHAYVAEGSYTGMDIVDISDREDPELTSHFATTGRAEDVVVSGDYAYLACYTNGLVIVDVSDETDPTYVGGYDTSGYSEAVVISGDYAYVADGSYGLVIIDISDRTDPQELGSYNTADYAQGVVVEGDYAYVADDENGLVIIDISDRTDPQEVGHCDTVRAFGLKVVGNYAYVADYTNGLVIIDISDRTDPQEIGHLDTDTYAYQVMVDGDMAYVCDGIGGLDLVNVTDKEEPRKCGHYDSPRIAYDVALSGDHLFLADYDNGVEIIEMMYVPNEKPVAYIDSISPDPANEGASVSFRGHGTDNGSIISYAWCSSIDGEFHNGTDGDLFQNSTLSPGNHTIHFRVMDNYDTWSDEVSATLDINEKPVAVIDSITPNPAHDEQIISFQGHGTDSDGSVTGFSWRSDLQGDLSTSDNFTTSSLVVAYHTIYFRVQDNLGFWSDEVSMALRVNKRPHAYLDSISTELALPTDTISFSGHGSDDGTIVRYVWNSSIDGEFYNDTEDGECEHSGFSVGEHVISFRVLDNESAWSVEKTATFHITSRPVAVIDSVSPNPALNIELVTFIGNGTDDGGIVQYAWCSSISGEFYNDSEVEVLTGILGKGEHTIYLKVKDDKGYWSNEVSIILVVHEKPEAHIDEVFPNPAKEGKLVNFSGFGTDDGEIIRYLWRSNYDGDIYEGSEASFSTSSLSPGTHTISLRVQDNHGAWSVWNGTTLKVYEKPTAIIFYVIPEFATPEDTIYFEGHGKKDLNVHLYVWRSSISGELYNGTEFQFNASSLPAGIHTIYLKVKDYNEMWSDEVSKTLVIHVPPVAEIDAITPASPLDTATITFTGNGTVVGPIVRYAWRLGDEELYNGTEAKFSHFGLAPGSYTITFRIEDSFGFWSDEVNTTLTITEDIASTITVDVEDLPTTITPGETITLTGEITVDPLRKIISASIQYDHDTPESLNIVNNSFSYEFTIPSGISEGEHYFEVTLTLSNGQTEEKSISFSYGVGEDSDSDGVADTEDDFPLDPAASKDSDGDGHPDLWNPGKSEKDSTTGLKLDEFPDDPEKWEKEDDGGGDDGPGFGVLVWLVAAFAVVWHSKRKRS